MHSIFYIKYQSVGAGVINFEGVSYSFIEEITRVLGLDSDLPHGQRDSS